MDIIKSFFKELKPVWIACGALIAFTFIMNGVKTWAYTAGFTEFTPSQKPSSKLKRRGNIPRLANYYKLRADVIKENRPDKKKKTASSHPHDSEDAAAVSEATVLSARASSVLESEKHNRYRALHLTDGNTKTSWCEGKKDDTGVGERFTVNLDKTVILKAFLFQNGFHAQKYYPANARIKTLRLDSGEIVQLKDSRKMQRVELKTPIKARSFTFTIDSVYEGTKYTDACITEIKFID